MPKHPRKNPYLCFRRTEKGYEISRFYEKEYAYQVSDAVGRFLLEMNGKRSPYTITSTFSRFEVDSLLTEFKRNDLLYSGRFLTGGIGSILIPFIFFDNYSNVNRHRKLCKLISVLLMFGALPCSILGLCLWLSNGYSSDQYNITGAILGGLLGVALHEAAHAVAAFGYRGRVYAAGVGLVFFLMPVAFVLMDIRIRNNLMRAQTHAIGIEMNLILFGVLMPISFSAAFINLLMALSNLIPIPGLDGYALLKELMWRDERRRHKPVLD